LNLKLQLKTIKQINLYIHAEILPPLLIMDFRSP